MAIAGLGSIVSQKILEHITGKTTYTKPAETFTALLKTMPATNKVTAKELEETYEVKTSEIAAYTRKATTWDAATEAGEVSKIKNTAELKWETLVGGPVTVKGYAIVTVKLGEVGDCIGAAELETAAEIGTGHTPATIAAKAIEISLK